MTETAMQKSAPEANGGEVTRSTRVPRVDILETEHELLLFGDLPGVKEDGVDIRFEKGELTLHARRSPPTVPNGYLLNENEPTDFFRSFRIGEKVAADKIWAELKDGVLKLHLPKVEAVKPRKIAVKGA